MSKAETVLLCALALIPAAVPLGGGQEASGYKALAPVTQDNLTVFPVVGGAIHDTSMFLSLDEGVRSGQVIVEEEGGMRGLVRPRPTRGPIPQQSLPGAQVNRLMLMNKSDRPLILLAGEIVTGGKQDRVVGKDRIVPAHSEPIDLSVFCVEPHRWVETSARFGSPGFSMAQPSVRKKAMASRNQQEVWNEVARSRAAVGSAVPAPVARALSATSSYAVTMDNGAVRKTIDAVAGPVEHAYGRLAGELRARKAVGAVVAVNGEIVWADVFASPALLEKYWPKLVRSYAAEAVSMRGYSYPNHVLAGNEAQAWLDQLSARHESVESEPGVYRLSELMGDDFQAFILASMLPGTGFDVHVAKMRQ